MWRMYGTWKRNRKKENELTKMGNISLTRESKFYLASKKATRIFQKIDHHNNTMVSLATLWKEAEKKLFTFFFVPIYKMNPSLKCIINMLRNEFKKPAAHLHNNNPNGF